jgi:hypothetical protein
MTDQPDRALLLRWVGAFTILFAGLVLLIVVASGSDKPDPWVTNCDKRGGTEAYRQEGKIQIGYCIVNNRVVSSNQ